MNGGLNRIKSRFSAPDVNHINGMNIQQLIQILRDEMRDFRYIEKGHGVDSLSIHEVEELRVDYDINTDGFYVLMPITKDEYNMIILKDAKVSKTIDMQNYQSAVLVDGNGNIVRQFTENDLPF